MLLAHGDSKTYGKVLVARILPQPDCSTPGSSTAGFGLPAMGVAGHRVGDGR